jgi:hypothetical protein
MGLVFEKPADWSVLIQLSVLASVFACLLWAMFAKVRGGIPPHLTYFAAIHRDIRELMDDGERAIRIGSETLEDRELKEQKDRQGTMGLLGLSAAILINFLLALTPWLLLTLFTPLRVIAY